MNLVVTNRNEEAYARRFDGTLYEFPTDKPVTIPVEAAAYLFGYGMTDADRQRILVRNGWQRNGLPGLAEGGPIAALKRLQNFVFKTAPEDEAKEKPVKSIAPSQREKHGVNAMSSLVGPNGQSKASRETIHLPGKKGERLQPVRP